MTGGHRQPVRVPSLSHGSNVTPPPVQPRRDSRPRRQHSGPHPFQSPRQTPPLSPWRSSPMLSPPPPASDIRLRGVPD